MGGQCLLWVVVSICPHVRDTLLSSISPGKVAGHYTWFRGSVPLCSEEGNLLSTSVGTLIR